MPPTSSRMPEFQVGFERHRIGQLAVFDAAHDRLKDSPVYRVGHVIGQEEVAHLVPCFVVRQESAQKGLLCLHVGRGGTLTEAKER